MRGPAWLCALGQRIPSLLFAVGLVALFVGGGAFAASISEQTTSQYAWPVSSPTPRLYVRNIRGNIIVRAGNVHEITVTLHERRTAATQESFDRSKELIRLEVESSGEGVSLIVGDADGAGMNTDVCRGCRVDYQFDISVPPDTNVDVGTVTDGRVEVSGIHGFVRASNVNGPVLTTDLSNCTRIDSVNGALDVQFAHAPHEDCTIETINGDISVGLPAGTGLHGLLRVHHGDFKSDFDVEPMMLPAKVEKETRNDRYGYRSVQPAGVRLGAGGPTFTLSSLNGDVRIRKKE